MNQAFLDHAIQQIDQITQRRGGKLVVAVGEPASTADLAACELYLNTHLPTSQQRILSKWNGISLKIYGQQQKLCDPKTALASYVFELYSTAQIVEHTARLRDFFALAWDDSSPYYNAERAQTLVTVAEIIEGDSRIMLDLTRPVGQGEFAIIEASLQYTEWLQEDGPAIAHHFDEFVERSLSTMIESELGFYYWYGALTTNDDFWAV